MKNFDDFVAAMRAEMDQATAKYPAPNANITALSAEAGEVADAVNKLPREAVIAEAVQCAVMAARLAIEGDPYADQYRVTLGLDATTPAPEATPMDELWDMDFGTAVVTPDYQLKPDGGRGSGRTTAQLDFALALLRAGANVMFFASDPVERGYLIEAARKKCSRRYFRWHHSSQTLYCAQNEAHMGFNSPVGMSADRLAGTDYIYIIDHRLIDDGFLNRSSFGKIAALVDRGNHKYENELSHIKPPQFWI